MRSIQVVAGLDPSHGGPSRSVPRLCKALVGAGCETRLLFVESADGKPLEAAEQPYVAESFPWDFARTPVLHRLRASAGLAHALRNGAAAADVIHDHGLWLMPNVYAGREAARARRPFVVSPRGMLSPTALGFSRTKKTLFWALAQGAVVRKADCIHATSQAEYEEIRGFGLTNPVAIIPNGIDVPALQEPGPRVETSERVVLSIGRIHPKKALDRLLRAWARIEADRPGWRLRIVGPAELGHDVQLRALARELELHTVSIEPAQYGAEKLRAYQEADLFVLPTLNENFGLTVAEALASGTPVICTKGAPWSGLEAEGCGWWVDHGVDSLAAALAEATAAPCCTLAAMGARGRTWMLRDFSWDQVGNAMFEVYRWLTRTGDAPASVRFS